MQRDKRVAWHRTDALLQDVEKKQIAVIGGIGRALSHITLRRSGSLILNRPRRPREADWQRCDFWPGRSGSLRRNGLGEPRFRRTPDEQCTDE